MSHYYIMKIALLNHLDFTPMNLLSLYGPWLMPKKERNLLSSREENNGIFALWITNRVNIYMLRINICIPALTNTKIIME